MVFVGSAHRSSVVAFWSRAKRLVSAGLRRSSIGRNDCPGISLRTGSGPGVCADCDGGLCLDLGDRTFQGPSSDSLNSAVGVSAVLPCARPPLFILFQNSFSLTYAVKDSFCFDFCRNSRCGVVFNYNRNKFHAFKFGRNLCALEFVLIFDF